MTIKIGILGDFILNQNLSIDPKIGELLNSTDFNVANLEAPFIEDQYLSKNKFGLFQKTENCEILKALNIKVVSLANNHIGDFGIEGFQKTIQILNNENIAFFGAGANFNEAIKSCIIELKDKKIAFNGFMMKFFTNKYFANKNKFGVNKFEIKNIINELKNTTADYKIIFNHWNIEYEDYPEPVMKYFSEKIIQNCNIILGSHPHCIQGIQSCNSKPIFYSLGNFAMPNVKYGEMTLTPYPKKCYKAFFTILNLSDNNIDYQIYPITMNADCTNIKLAESTEKENIINLISKISEPLNLSYSKYIKFYNKNKNRKLLFTLTKSEFINLIITFVAVFIKKTIEFLQKLIFKLLKILKLDNFIKQRFTKILSKINSVK